MATDHPDEVALLKAYAVRAGLDLTDIELQDLTKAVECNKDFAAVTRRYLTPEMEPASILRVGRGGGESLRG